MLRKTPTKDRDLFRHARQRFAIRFDIKLTKELERRIVKDIQDDNAIFIDKQSNAISRHRITLEGREIDVIYDRGRKALVTALYPNDRFEDGD